MIFNQNNRGITVIEVVIGTAILAAVLVGITTVITQMVQARERVNSNLQALYLAESGYEYLRHLRDDAWTNIDGLTVDTYYFLSLSSSTISTTASPEIINGEFLRRFHVRSVYRDTNDDIVASTSGGTIDDESYEVWVEVGGQFGTSTLKGVLTNIFVE